MKEGCGSVGQAAKKSSKTKLERKDEGARGKRHLGCRSIDASNVNSQEVEENDTAVVPATKAARVKAAALGVNIHKVNASAGSFVSVEDVLDHHATQCKKRNSGHRQEQGKGASPEMPTAKKVRIQDPVLDGKPREAEEDNVGMETDPLLLDGNVLKVPWSVPMPSLV